MKLLCIVLTGLALTGCGPRVIEANIELHFKGADTCIFIGKPDGSVKFQRLFEIKRNTIADSFTLGSTRLKGGYVGEFNYLSDDSPGGVVSTDPSAGREDIPIQKLCFSGFRTHDTGTIVIRAKQLQ